MERFTRTIQLLGINGFSSLNRARVTIVGIGAVGGYAMEGLARAGIGQLRLVDFDSIEPSNINRQILALESTIGQKKVMAACKRVKEINPDCEVEGLELFATEKTMETILSPRPDLLIDAIDALNPKCQLLESAYAKEITTISSMGAALRTDPGKIKTADLFDTSVCPLARHLRRRLRRRGVGRGILSVYSDEPAESGWCADLEGADIHFDGRGRRRNILGSLPTITGIFGLTIAAQAINHLSKGQASQPG